MGTKVKEEEGGPREEREIREREKEKRTDKTGKQNEGGGQRG